MSGEEILVDEILTLDEVAKYLKVSDRTVYEWAQRGQIPAGKIGTVWRFKKSELEQWVNARLLAKKGAFRSGGIDPRAIIFPERIVFLNYSSKREALLSLAENISTAPEITNPQELSREIIKREELMSTAIGCGIAIPHIRLSSILDLVISVGISRTDITDFQTLDGEPVRLLIMIAAAYNQHAYYLQTLSFFSTRLKSGELRNAILASNDRQEAYGILTGSHSNVMPSH
jgi:PTS system nitrogen regulatory IIA component